MPAVMNMFLNCLQSSGKDGIRWPFLLIVPYVAICALMCVNFIEQKCEEMQLIQSDSSEVCGYFKKFSCTVRKK